MANYENIIQKGLDTAVIEIGSPFSRIGLLDPKSKVTSYTQLTNKAYWTFGGAYLLAKGLITYVETSITDHPSGVYVCTDETTNPPTWVAVNQEINLTVTTITAASIITEDNYEELSDGVYASTTTFSIDEVAIKPGDLVLKSDSTYTVLDLSGVKFKNSGTVEGLVGYAGDDLIKTDLTSETLFETALSDGQTVHDVYGKFTITNTSSGEVVLSLYCFGDGTEIATEIVGDDGAQDVNGIEFSVASSGTLVVSLNFNSNFRGTTTTTSDNYTFEFKFIKNAPARGNHSHPQYDPKNHSIEFGSNHKVVSNLNGNDLTLLDAPTLRLPNFNKNETLTTTDIAWENIPHIYAQKGSEDTYYKVTFIYSTDTLKAGWLGKNLLVLKKSESSETIQYAVIDPEAVSQLDTFQNIASVVPLWQEDTILPGYRCYVTPSKYILYSAGNAIEFD